MLNKRNHPRLPVIKNIAKEIFISTDKGFFQGLIVNFSVNGLLLLMYENIPVGTSVCFVFDYPPLDDQKKLNLC